MFIIIIIITISSRDRTKLFDVVAKKLIILSFLFLFFPNGLLRMSYVHDGGRPPYNITIIHIYSIYHIFYTRDTGRVPWDISVRRVYDRTHIDNNERVFLEATLRESPFISVVTVLVRIPKLRCMRYAWLRDVGKVAGLSYRNGNLINADTRIIIIILSEKNPRFRFNKELQILLQKYF